MTVRFYVSDDGEVLSNKDFPVRGELLMVPVSTGYDYATEEHVTHMRIKTRVFRAITLRFPSDAELA